MLPLSQLPECNRYWSLAIAASRVFTITTAKPKSLQMMWPSTSRKSFLGQRQTGAGRGKTLPSWGHMTRGELRRCGLMGIGLGSYIALPPVSQNEDSGAVASPGNTVRILFTALGICSVELLPKPSTKPWRGFFPA